MQIDSWFIANANWPNVVKTKIAAMHIIYLVVNIMSSCCSGELSDEEESNNNDGQWDGKTRWDHLPKVKVKAKQLGVIDNKLHDRI
jgi:hypothetical protein